MITFSSRDHLYVAVLTGCIIKGSTAFSKIVKRVQNTEKVGNHWTSHCHNAVIAQSPRRIPFLKKWSKCNVVSLVTEFLALFRKMQRLLNPTWSENKCSRAQSCNGMTCQACNRGIVYSALSDDPWYTTFPSPSKRSDKPCVVLLLFQFTCPITYIVRDGRLERMQPLHSRSLLRAPDVADIPVHGPQCAQL